MSTQTEKALDQIEKNAIETAALAEEVKISEEAKSKKIEASDTKSDREVKKSALREVFIETPKAVYGATVVPLIEFVKGTYLQAKSGANRIWLSEKEAYEELGFLKYILDRSAKVGFKLAKLAAGVTIAMIIADLSEAYLAVDIFSFEMLGMILGASLLFVIVRSVLDQKEVSDSVSPRKVGADVVSAFNAA